MGNERITENLVRDMLRRQGYYDNEGIRVEEQSSSNRKIDNRLKGASKSGKGKGYPEFIISFSNKPDNIIVIECKADVARHERKTKEEDVEYSKYAVDGALWYASHLKDGFNVMAIAISGETEKEMRISYFSWLKGKQTYKEVDEKSFLDPTSLFGVIERQSSPLNEDELIKKAVEYNDELHSYSIPEVERCTLISSVLVALQDSPFSKSYSSYQSDNEDLIDALLAACERVLRRNHIDGYKSEVILREYGKVRSNHTFRSKKVITQGTEQQNTILRDLIDDINQNIMPYVNENVYDVLGQFYTQFIRYAGSDKKTGLVLTPSHITDLFCELAELNSKDVVFDPCCGTGGFLVSAMNYLFDKSGNDQSSHQRIKSSQLVGIEQRADMFSHACSNMMMRGDGKSNVFFGDCFSRENFDQIKSLKPTKAFLNPPYDGGEARQLEFVENALEYLEKGGVCVAIVQMSAAISSKSAAVAVRQRLLENHTVNAVLSMPDDLFHPIGVITAIMVMTAHAPHPENKETFFGYFKDDGFIKAKHKGRIDSKNKWPDIKKTWLDAYINRREIAGLSVNKVVTASDEWCAEAYMETDYSTLSDDDFIKTIRNYVAFQFLQGKD